MRKPGIYIDRVTLIFGVEIHGSLGHQEMIGALTFTQISRYGEIWLALYYIRHLLYFEKKD